MPSDSDDRSKALRARLAAVGISLDEPTVSRVRARSPSSEPPPNRAALRAILRSRGAPERDLEWLIASCPSKAAARAYTAPPAWATAPPVVLPEPEYMAPEQPRELAFEPDRHNVTPSSYIVSEGEEV